MSAKRTDWQRIHSRVMERISQAPRGGVHAERTSPCNWYVLSTERTTGRSAGRKLVKPTTFPEPLYLHRCPSDGILLALDMRAGPQALTIDTAAGQALTIDTAAGPPRMRSGDREVLTDVGHRDDPMGGTR
jgi:hypothetical protein